MKTFILHVKIYLIIILINKETLEVLDLQHLFRSYNHIYIYI